MDLPLVSVIVPFYNRLYLISDILLCIQQQSYPNIEVIVVDDGSEIPLLIKDHMGLDIKFIRLEVNKGAGNARRIGREMAIGRYVCYLDSDDSWSKNFIEECVKTIESDLSIGMVYTNTVKVVNGIKTKWRATENLPVSILPPVFINPRRIWSTPSCLWKNTVSLAEHWKPNRNYEDFIHDINCAKINNKIKFVPQAYTYNNHDANNRIPRDSHEVMKSLNEIIKIRRLPNYDGISFFFISRVYEFNLRIEILNLKKYIILPFFEYKWKLNKYILYYFLLISFGVFNIRSYKMKSYIDFLK